MKNSKGISLIALIITIIVIVILAAVVVTTSINTPKSANYAVFCSNIGEAQQSVALAYADRYTTIAATNGGVVSAAQRKTIYSTIAGNAASTPTLPSAITDELKADPDTLTYYLVTNGNTTVSASTALQGMRGKASGSDVLSDCEIYITSMGEVFMYPGYENTDGNDYVTATLYY